MIASGDDHLNLANSFLCVRTKITRVNDDLDAADMVGPVNNFLQSLYSQMDALLSATLLTSSTNTYAFKAFIDRLSSYGIEARLSHLISALFTRTKQARWTDRILWWSTERGENRYWPRDRNSDRKSAMDMIGPIHAKMFFDETYTLNEVNAKIRLVRSNDTFCLMATRAHQFEAIMTAASLLICLVENIPSVFLAHAETNGTLKYPYL
jgi:hypothetical protein